MKLTIVLFSAIFQLKTIFVFSDEAISAHYPYIGLIVVCGTLLDYICTPTFSSYVCVCVFHRRLRDTNQKKIANLSRR